MEPNESMRGRTGEPISFSGDYEARCCSAVEKLIAGHSFPDCSEHGETVWNWIPPFVQNDFGTAALIKHWKRLRSRSISLDISDSVGLRDSAAVRVISSIIATPFEALAQ